MALTVTDDHAVKELVSALTGSGWHPNSIRRRLPEADVLLRLPEQTGDCAHASGARVPRFVRPGGGTASRLTGALVPRLVTAGGAEKGPPLDLPV
jgi:hypothetical protein